MGQAAKRKKRLGKWYGRPIGPGHPDFVPPKKPEPIRPLLRFGPFDALGMVVETKIDSFKVYADRIEVEFINGKSDANWPVHHYEPIEGELRIGSREFGVAKLYRHTPTGCVFLRSQVAQEESNESGTTVDPSDEHRTQEEPITSQRRPTKTVFAVRRIPLLFSTLAVAMLGMTSIPDPEHRPKKR